MLILLLAAGSFPARAGGGADESDPPLSAVIPDNGWIDRTHEYLSHESLASVQWFDDFFGDKTREPVAPAESTIRWRNNFRIGTDRTLTYRTDLRASVRLNQLSRKFRLVFSSEAFEDALGINRDATGLQGVSAGGTFRSSSTELRYETINTPRTQADLGAGVLIKLPLVVYVRARYRYTQPLSDNTLVRFAPTVFSRTHDGLGQSTAIDLEHALDDATLLRWANAETTTQISSGMEWTSEASAFHAFAKDRAATVAAGMSGATRPAATVNTYYVLARYRMSVLRPWLFVEAEPIQSWVRGGAGGYHPVSAVTFRVEFFLKGEREQDPKPGT
jgi:hypothetical protein